MSKYPAHYDSYLRAHFQGIGAATAGSGVGVNDPQTIFGLPLDPSISGSLPDGYVLTWNATQGYWTAKLGSGSLPALTDRYIWIGNSSNVATGVLVSGDITNTDAGVFTIKTNVALAGSPTTTTQSAGDNSTKIATTAFTTTAISNATSTAITSADSPVQGDVLYYNGSAWKMLAPGTAGYVLQTNGTGQNPTWVSGPAGSTGNTYCLFTSTTDSVNAVAVATRGNFFVPLVNATLDQISFAATAVNAHVYQVTICTVTFSTGAIINVLQTGTVTAGSSGAQMLTVGITPVSFIAGTCYGVLITDTSLANGTTAVGVHFTGGNELFTGLPIDPTIGLGFGGYSTLSPANGTARSNTPTQPTSIIMRVQL